MGPHPIGKMLGSAWPRHENSPIPTRGLCRVAAAPIMNCFAVGVRLLQRLQMPALGLDFLTQALARQGEAESLLPREGTIRSLQLERRKLG